MLEVLHFILLFALLVTVTIFYNSSLQKQGISKSPRRNKVFKVLFLILAWIGYQFMLSVSGLLSDLGLPPRVPLLIIVPSFIFTGIFLYKNRKHSLLDHIPLHWLVFFQSFRIFVELLIWGNFKKGFIPVQTTFEGWNFELEFAITALIIGFLFLKKKVSQKIILLWNYLGLAMLAIIVAIFMTSLYTPSLWGSETTEITAEFAKFPYLLIASFFMPLAVFVHVLSIVKIKKG